MQMPLILVGRVWQGAVPTFNQIFYRTRNVFSTIFPRSSQRSSKKSATLHHHSTFWFSHPRYKFNMYRARIYLQSNLFRFPDHLHWHHVQSLSIMFSPFQLRVNIQSVLLIWLKKLYTLCRVRSADLEKAAITIIMTQQ